MNCFDDDSLHQHQTLSYNTMSTPTVSSINSDKALDRAMGHAGATSGGRGVRKYELQMTRRERERLENSRKQQALLELRQAKDGAQKLLDTKRAMEAGELDYM